MVSDANYGSYCPSSCASLQVKATEKQFNSTKLVALNKMKFGSTPTSVSKEMQTPVLTLARWKKDSMDTSAGKWTDAAGDSALARPAKRKTDPGSGSNGRKVTENIKRKMKAKLKRNPWLTPCGLQQEIPELRDVSQSNIRRVISKELKIPSRRAAKKPFLTEAQKIRRLDWANKHRGWSRAKWAKVL